MFALCQVVLLSLIAHDIRPAVARMHAQLAQKEDGLQKNVPPLEILPCGSGATPPFWHEQVVKPYQLLPTIPCDVEPTATGES